MNVNHQVRTVLDATANWPVFLPLDRAKWRPWLPALTVTPGRWMPSGRRLRVSVIIPCFNYGHFLPAATASAVEQSGVEVEVIIVDDASTDDSLRVALSLAESHPNVEVLRNATNTGHVIAFNNGLERASGDLIVRLDADDLLTPGSLGRAASLFRSFPNVGLVYGHPRHFDSPLPPTPRVREVTWTIWNGRDWVAERCRRGVNCITTPEAVVRASVIRQVGPLDTRLRFAQDMEMWLRVASFSDVGRINGADQALHRDHPASMSVTEAAGVMTDLTERREVFRVLFDSVREWLPGSDALHSVAREALAREALTRAIHDHDRARVNLERESELVRFARDVFPGWADLPESRALALRWRAERALPRWQPIFAIAAVARRVRSEASYVRWVRNGL